MTYPYGYCLIENDDADKDAHGFLSDMDAANASDVRQSYGGARAGHQEKN